MAKPESLTELFSSLLARQDEVVALDLLLLSGMLRPDQLDGWLQGQIPLLEDALAAPAACLQWLREACFVATRLGLSCEARVQVDQHGRELRAFRDPEAEQLMRSCFRQEPYCRQLDLFADNVAIISLHQARVAVLAGQLDEARAALQPLLGQALHQDVATALQTIIRVSQSQWPAHELAVSAAVTELRELIEPAARVLLGTDAPSYLVSFRRALAERAEREAFDAASPQLHASTLWLAAGDPERALRCIASEAQPTHHELLATAIQAQLMLDRRHAALATLCEFCWRWPARADRWMESSARGWLRECIEDFWDLDPLPEVGAVPAWLLSRGHRELLDTPIAEDLQDRKELQLFRLIAQLVRQPRDLSLRRRLAESQPQLFEQWKQTVVAAQSR